MGKVAVADGKEVAAQSIQCAAESEGFLAQAERAKGVTPLCDGVGATALSFALLVPVLLASLAVEKNLQLVTEVYLCCPLVAVLAAAVSSLALLETRSFLQSRDWSDEPGCHRQNRLNEKAKTRRISGRHLLFPSYQPQYWEH